MAAQTHEEVAARVAAAFGNLAAVEAVAMAGSWLAGAADERSDADLYVYATEPPAMRERRAVASAFARRWEVGNDFWEPGDEWIDAERGIHVDVIYRTPGWIEEELDRVLERHEASLGYSTCLWHNVLHSTPLFDRNGWYGGLRAIAARPYPEELRRAIVARNHPVLRTSFSSYVAQIARAVARDDGVSVQHRVTALLASSFDILFAVNRLPHPGEKRLVRFAIARCPALPEGFEARLDALLGMAAQPASPAIVDRANALLDGLDDLLIRERLL